MQYCMYYHSPVGQLLLTSDGTSLTGLAMDASIPEGACPGDGIPVLEQTGLWLDAYFAGRELPVDFPLAPAGTAFRQQVWTLLREIPFGTTRTYGDLAKEMARLAGKERMSSQAIGSAVGANPIAILIPCHRVLGAGGTLTGYAWGLERKAWLLEHERGGKS